MNSSYLLSSKLDKYISIHRQANGELGFELGGGLSCNGDQNGHERSNKMGLILDSKCKFAM